MPASKMISLLIVVISLAAATVTIALIAMDQLQISPFIGLAILSLVSLCAALGWRLMSQRRIGPK